MWVSVRRDRADRTRVRVIAKDVLIVTAVTVTATLDAVNMNANASNDY
jgi:hypothetical protein